MKIISISDLMNSSGVKFGTSGARGLVVQMTDSVCYSYAMAFLQYLESNGDVEKKVFGVGGDLRSSTSRIMNACVQAALDFGWEAINYGHLPSPALALKGIELGLPTAMVTGSHIPDDRNGIKFNTALGEITKKDELGMKSQTVEFSADVFNDEGEFSTPREKYEIDPSAMTDYEKRYLDYFGNSALKGLKIGVYQHSTVGREVLLSILESLGAEAVGLGWSDKFIPVDTEAIRPEDEVVAKDWRKEYKFDAIISADGDADRPLLADEKGDWLRGDVLGILAADYLKVEGLATPVSCNSAVEKSNFFKEVARTKIGSPFVIEAMEGIAEKGMSAAGYEANGGFLLQSDVSANGKVLKALPTRDAALPVIAALLGAKESNKTLSKHSLALPNRYTASNRLQEFPTEKSKEILGQFTQEGLVKFDKEFAVIVGAKAKSVDSTDGLRVVFENEEIVHLRPSGNAPEFRCYNEAAEAGRALELNVACLSHMESWK